MLTLTNTQRSSGYEDRVVTKPPTWHGLVVLDVLFNNLTTGLFLVAATCELAWPTLFTKVATWAYSFALVFLLIDLGLLVLDLGDKFRFHHMLRVFKPSSPMSLGTWCLTAYSLFLTAIIVSEFVVVLGWFPGDAGPAWWLRKLAVIGGLPFCFGSAMYKGVLFSTTSQPGWKDARWLGAYLMNSAVLLGTAELLLIAAVMVDVRAVDLLRPVVGVLAIFNLIPLWLLANDLRPALSRIYTKQAQFVATAVAVLIGALLPLVLLAGGSGVVLAVAVLLVIVVIQYGVRHVIVYLPHKVT